VIARHPFSLRHLQRAISSRMNSTKPARSIIIPAAGSGTRFQSVVPKQLHTIAGEPILIRTIRTACAVANVGSICVGMRGDIDQWYLWLREHGVTDDRVHVFEGADERQLTVMRGLNHWSLNDSAEDGIVLVHDAVRPLATVGLWERVATAAEEHGAAIPALPIADTVKAISEGRVTSTLNRTNLVRVQTPQGFRKSLLRSAYEEAIRDGLSVTDCASVMELANHVVRIVDGDETNFKITTPYDLTIAEFIVANFAQ